MKKLLVPLFILIATLITALSVGAYYREDNPFTDVTVDDWFYDSALFCYENSLFSGTGKTTFSPKSKMTRAMLCTVLAKADGYNEADYDKSAFDDVVKGKWYYTAVCYCSEKGMVSGVGNNKFAPNSPITREQSALMLQKYAVVNGLSDGKSSFDITSYSDSASISAWAKDAICWCCENGIMSGTSETTLSPKATTTRSAFSVMLRRLLALKPKRTINSNDLSLYTIIIPENAEENVAKAANDLSKYLALATGIELSVKDDTTPDTQYEILVGKTNRTKTATDELTELQFKVEVIGDKLNIVGKTDKERVRGTLYGVYYLLEKKFGVSFFKDSLITYDADPIIDLADGYTYIDGPAFETRVVCWTNGWDDVYMNDEYYHMFGLPHNMGNFIKDIEGDEPNPNPCLSDRNNINALISNLRKYLVQYPDTDSLHLVQNDSSEYCRCTKCLEAYREDGSRSATIIRLCNAVSDEMSDEIEGLQIFTWAYYYTIKPPKVTKPRDNINLYFNSLIYCPSHTYSDENCTMNSTFFEYLDEWNSIVNKVYVWDHSANFYHSLSPFQGLYDLLQNAADFKAHGVSGVFNNAVTDPYGEFGEVRAFLFTHLYRNPDMSVEEYTYLINSALKAFYGNGWRALRDYLDLIEVFTEGQCFGFNSPPDGAFDFDLVTENEEKILSLWETAENGTTNDTQKDNLKRSSISMRYILQCARYTSWVVNGTEQTKAEYAKINKALYNDIEAYDVRWSEHDARPTSYAPLTSPLNW